MKRGLNGVHHAPTTSSLIRIETSTRHSRATREAYNDGTFVGFVLGLAAALIFWLVLSGTLMRICVALVRSTLALDAGV